jgi:hypothetical protein
MQQHQHQDVEMAETQHSPCALALIESQVVKPVAPSKAKAVLSWANLNVTVGNSDKVLIHDEGGRYVGIHL